MTPEEIEAVVRKAVTDELSKFFSNSQPKTYEQWQNTGHAWKSLSLDSAEQLRDLARSGLMKSGIHYRDTRLNGRVKPRLQFNIEECSKLLNQHPSKRKTYKHEAS